jgi:hypothetical protein
MVEELFQSKLGAETVFVARNISTPGALFFLEKWRILTRYYLLLTNCQCCGSGPVGSICFGPPGSESDASQRHGSTSGYFYHQAKIVKKP